MSTKSSIFFENGIHVYNEVITEEMCIEIDYIDLETRKPVVLNEKYDSHILTKEQWLELARSIFKFYKVQP